MKQFIETTKWELRPLQEIAEVIMGQSPPSTSYNDKKNGLPFFQGKAEFGTLYPTIKKWCSEPNKIAEAGDILISVRAPVGPTNVAPEKCCIGRGLAAIRSRDVTQEFLLHFFRFIEPYLSKEGSGSTFQAIKSTQLRSILIPVPASEEQQLILSRINDFFSVIDYTENQLKVISGSNGPLNSKIGLLKQSILKQAFEGKLV